MGDNELRRIQRRGRRSEPMLVLGPGMERMTAQLDLRAALGWRVDDEYRAAIDACGRHIARDASCWVEFPSRLTGTELEVGRALPRRCHNDDFTRDDHFDYSPVLECLALAIGRVGDVFVSDAAASELGDYSGPVQIELFLAAPAASDAPEPNDLTPAP